MPPKTNISLTAGMELPNQLAWEEPSAITRAHWPRVEILPGRTL